MPDRGSSAFPAVTLVVTTHERPTWLEQSLRSLLVTADNARAGVRILVIDDASRDPATGEVAKRLGVEYVHLPVNVGLARARAYAMAQADGDYVAFCDDDDVFRPDWLPLALEKAQTGYDVVGSSYVETDADLVPLRTHHLLTTTFADLLAGHVWTNDSSLIRMSALDGVSLRPERETAMMMTLWLDLAARGARFAVVPKPTWYRRLHASNMSAGIGGRDALLRRQAIAEHL